MSETFDVVLTNKLVPGKDRQEVLEALARLFKIQQDKVERILHAGHFVVKRQVEHVVALRYQATLRQAGVFALIKPAGTNLAQTRPSDTSKNKTTPDSATNLSTATSTTANAKPSSPSEQVQQDPSGTPLTTTLGVGEGLSKRDEPLPVSVPQFEVAPPGTELLKGVNKPTPAPPPSTEHLSLAPAGERLAEPRRTSAKEIVPEGLSLAEPGEPLSDGRRRPPPPDINIAHLSLDNN